MRVRVRVRAASGLGLGLASGSGSELGLGSGFGLGSAPADRSCRGHHARGRLGRPAPGPAPGPAPDPALGPGQLRRPPPASSAQPSLSARPSAARLSAAPPSSQRASSQQALSQRASPQRASSQRACVACASAPWWPLRLLGSRAAFVAPLIASASTHSNRPPQRTRQKSASSSLVVRRSGLARSRRGRKAPQPADSRTWPRSVRRRGPAPRLRCGQGRF